jgi:hypothetical protein
MNERIDVMASGAISTPLRSTLATTANEAAAINSMLQRRLECLDLKAVEISPVHQYNEVAPFIKDAEVKRKMKAEKRLNAKLRKLEIEQKQILLAEAQKSLEEARHRFESEPQVPYDYSPRLASTINDLFREEKERNRLIVL